MEREKRERESWGERGQKEEGQHEGGGKMTEKRDKIRNEERRERRWQREAKGRDEGRHFTFPITK